MKKNKGLIIILLILALVTAYFIFTDKSSTLNKELSDFAVEDTASINKIFLADRLGAQVTLIKEAPGQWRLNGINAARNDAVDMLLYTLKAVEVRSPVSRFSYDPLIKQLASSGVKVEIYQKDKLVKTYYVGGATQDHLGTFMYLENSTVPFITHIPGFNGFLTPRYFTSVNDWKDRSVFRIMPKNIASVVVTDKENANGNFRIIYNNASKNYELYDASGRAVTDANVSGIESYLDFYTKIDYEGIADRMTPRMRDSLFDIGSFLNIDVTDKTGKIQHAEFYRKAVDRRTLSLFDEGGKEPKYDLDRMFTRLDKDTFMVVTQYLLFDKFFRKIDDFKKPTVVIEKKD